MLSDVPALVYVYCNVDLMHIMLQYQGMQFG